MAQVIDQVREYFLNCVLFIYKVFKVIFSMGFIQRIFSMFFVHIYNINWIAMRYIFHGVHPWLFTGDPFRVCNLLIRLDSDDEIIILFSFLYQQVPVI